MLKNLYLAPNLEEKWKNYRIYLSDNNTLRVFAKTTVFMLTKQNTSTTYVRHLAENRRFIIERVLTRGRMSDWWVLIHLYSFDVIKTEVVQIRYLDKVTLNFCSTFFHLPKTAFRCYNQPQSIQQLWQY